jgi:hypothetical protein
MPCSPWVSRKVAEMFAGRKGHGGGPCCSRVLDADQLRTILQDAYEAGGSLLTGPSMGRYELDEQSGNLRKISSENAELRDRPEAPR